MIDLDFVERLIRSIDESTIDSIEIERGGTRIRLSKTPTTTGPAPAPSVNPPSAQTTGNPPPAEPAPIEAAPPDAGNLIEVPSPMVGTFYRAPSPGADSFTEVGARITPGQTLCIIEAMKLMNELESEVEGVVREVCVENGEPVEYGQVLFRVEPS